MHFHRCRTSSNCTGFLLNYETESCSRVITGSNRGLDIRAQIRPSSRKVNYFEKVCLKGKVSLKKSSVPGLKSALSLSMSACLDLRACSWVRAGRLRRPRAFASGNKSRVPGHLLGRCGPPLQVSRVRLQKEGVQVVQRNKEDAAGGLQVSFTEGSVLPKEFVFKIDYSTFRASIDDMEYLENQCADDPQDRVSCDYQEYENQDLGFPDLLISGVSKEEVRS